MKEINRFHSKVNGSSFAGSQDILRSMNTGDKIIPVRELDNMYDKNAIALYNESKQKLGYIPAFTAKDLSRQIDEGLTVDVTVSEITGRDKSFVGCNLLVIVYETL